MTGSRTFVHRYQEAQDAAVKDSVKGIELLNQLVYSPETVTHAEEDKIRVKEQAILELGGLLSKSSRGQELANLIRNVRPFLSLVSKAKAAKLVRQLVDLLLEIQSSGDSLEVGIPSVSADLKESVVRECITWAEQEKRVFLKQTLESRLVSLLFEMGKYVQSLELAATLLKLLKKTDDKTFLVEVLMLESKSYFSLQNLPKSKASLTSARTTANGIYIPPKVQASLDLQSGILYAADEKDFKTAFSYFYEAFEAYDSGITTDEFTSSIMNDVVKRPSMNSGTSGSNTGKAVVSLKYMLLAKIMLNLPDEVMNIITGKLALRYSGLKDIEAIKGVALAASKRSLSDFQLVLSKYGKQLISDPIINSHLNDLYDKMLEQNLLRIIEPYSRIQVSIISAQIALPRQQVEKKLSQMILDGLFEGILDHVKHQGIPVPGEESGVLVVYESKQTNGTYDAVLDTMESMSHVVDALYLKAQKLS